jgi:hypothetical protein
MSRSRYPLTPAVQQAVIAYIRGGGFPSVAAEAAGIPRDVFDSWIQQGEKPRARQRFRDFALAVRQAAAQARLGAEVAVRDDKPLDWLRCGPGRETAEVIGWTGPARPRTAAGAAPCVLLDPDVQVLSAGLLRALESQPEARSIASEFFASCSLKK